MFAAGFAPGSGQEEPNNAAILMWLAIVLALILGTLGYLLVGFGTLTGCTDAYACTETGCAPCQGAQHWLLSGAVIQGALVVIGLAMLLVARWRAGTRRALIVVATAIAVASFVTVISTKVGADHSFCQAGDAGYEGGCAGSR